MNLYRDEASNPKYNAQRNLIGRTHYVDDDTLRFHKSRILETHVCYQGLVFALIETCALDPHGHKRGYRAVVFDVFGTVLSRPTLEETQSTLKAARKELRRVVNALDAKAHTANAIDRARRQYAEEMDRLSKQVFELAVGDVREAA